MASTSTSSSRPRAACTLGGWARRLHLRTHRHRPLHPTGTERGRLVPSCQSLAGGIGEGSLRFHDADGLGEPSRARTEGEGISRVEHPGVAGPRREEDRWIQGRRGSLKRTRRIANPHRPGKGYLQLRRSSPRRRRAGPAARWPSPAAGTSGPCPSPSSGNRLDELPVARHLEATPAAARQ